MPDLSTEESSGSQEYREEYSGWEKECGWDGLWPLKAHELGQLTADLVPFMMEKSGKCQ